MKSSYPLVLFGIVALGVVTFAGLLFLPLGLLKPRTLTVTGEASTYQKNEVATFTAGVSGVGSEKEKVLSEVNGKMTTLTAAVKGFGIPAADIKTQNVTIYQEEETYYEKGVAKIRLGQWRASNSISITLREVGRASELADLLGRSGANNVGGPNFSTDGGDDGRAALLGEAVANAKAKAKIVAQSSGEKLGKIVSITEGAPTYSYPLRAEGLGGGSVPTPTEPGTTPISASVTVIFELRPF